MSSDFNHQVNLRNGRYMYYCDTDEVMRLLNDIIELGKNYSKFVVEFNKYDHYLQEGLLYDKNNKIAKDALEISNFVNNLMHKIKIEGYDISNQHIKTVLHNKCQDYNFNEFDIAVLDLEKRYYLNGYNNSSKDSPGRTDLREVAIELERVGHIINGYNNSYFTPRDAYWYMKRCFTEDHINILNGVKR